jgi:septal ring factor EnvC (AmiA/AmiB activator)
MCERRSLAMSKSGTMERNKWETALRCLEVALHPNTGDDEVIAAVNGFRRTADGRGLRDICAMLAGPQPAGATILQTAELAALRAESRDLRNRLAAAEQARAGGTEQLHAAVEELAQLRDELRAARDAAAASERRFAEFRQGQNKFSDRLARENAELRRTLETARPAAPSFGTALASALGQPGSRPATSERVHSANVPPSAPRDGGAAWVA